MGPYFKVAGPEGKPITVTGAEKFLGLEKHMPGSFYSGILIFGVIFITVVYF